MLLLKMRTPKVQGSLNFSRTSTLFLPSRVFYVLHKQMIPHNGTYYLWTTWFRQVQNLELNVLEFIAGKMKPLVVLDIGPQSLNVLKIHVGLQ